ncbi:TetR/AcrR family transcriptional regulator [Georgenia sp. SYP-B2076]|uniref:TetR/AcrR family transcriptional regulator n=1 Tax=Georgenia sp. SYP-B2076 TaxID=2495881 RepID=UPI000F8EE8D2|nr:TetR family transcriptional regulator [Georgenia sp. SYP-B2076]
MTVGSKGERRRSALVEAAAAIVLAEGPAAVTHRAVAQRAGCSLSATTYYFGGLEDLLGAAGSLLVGRWAEQAERVLDRLRTPGPTGAGRPPDRPTDVPAPEIAAAVLDALLPGPGQVRGHYQQLLAAGGTPAVARAYRAGRERLDAAVGGILTLLGSRCPPALAVAVVDGAVVSALSEGGDVRKTATDLLGHVV